MITNTTQTLTWSIGFLIHTLCLHISCSFVL